MPVALKPRTCPEASLASNQAIAAWATEQPLAAAISRSLSTTSKPLGLVQRQDVEARAALVAFLQVLGRVLAERKA
jgi:hypothetical protein